MPSLANLSVLALVLATVASAFELQPHRNILRKRAAPNLPGVSNKNLRKGNLAIGFIPAWDEPKDPANVADMNRLLPKPMSLVGHYYQLSKGDPKLDGLDKHVQEILSQKSQFGGDNPVFNIAMGAPAGLNYVTPSVAKAIAAKMAEINSKGLTVYLRFLWEMNGDWYAWGEQPAPFLSKWKLVTNAVRANKRANRTYMTWSPNSRFGGLNDKHGGWTPYWPGAKFVDIVSLSYYSYGGFDRENIAPPANFLSSMLADFQKNFAAKYNKPIILSETSAAYTVNLDTGKPNTGGDSELKIKSTWLGQLLSTANQKKFPYYKGIVIFNIIKDESATGNSPVREEDFRYLLGNKAVQQNTLKQLGKGT